MTTDHTADVARLREENAALRADLAAARAFKTWVHDYLDGKGVPHHPPGTHGAEGCRIGDRMDYVWSDRDRLARRVNAGERLSKAAAEAWDDWNYKATPPDVLAASMVRLEEKAGEFDDLAAEPAKETT